MDVDDIRFSEDGTALVMHLPGTVDPGVHEAIAAEQEAVVMEHARQLRGAETLEEAEAKAQAVRDASAAVAKPDGRRHYYLRGLPRTITMHGPDDETTEVPNPAAGPYKLELLTELTTISTPHGPATGLPGAVLLATHASTKDQHFVAVADYEQYEQ